MMLLVWTSEINITNYTKFLQMHDHSAIETKICSQYTAQSSRALYDVLLQRTIFMLSFKPSFASVPADWHRADVQGQRYYLWRTPCFGQAFRWNWPFRKDIVIILKIIPAVYMSRGSCWWGLDRVALLRVGRNGRTGSRLIFTGVFVGNGPDFPV